VNEVNTDHYLRINEIKNYYYCARITYYALCLRLDRETGLSRMGVAAEAEVKGQMRRRRTALHAVVQGERRYDVALVSHTVRLTGRIDEMVITGGGSYLVDYKDTARDYGYWRAQMCAYRLCAAEQGLGPVLGCYVYTIPTQQYQEVRLTRRDEADVMGVRDAVEAMVGHEVCPPPTPHTGKCRTCQYRRFCNDVE
jgi:CRISPR-associated exonuclease Cas4